MKQRDAQKILQSLLDGIDPITGEILPEDHLCNHPTVIRALHTAVVLLEKQRPVEAAPKPERLENAGKPWTGLEDERMILMFETGTSITELSRIFQRTRTAIRARMVRLGLYERRKQVPEYYEGDDE